MKKRALAAVLALAMVIALLPVGVLAQDNTMTFKKFLETIEKESSGKDVTFDGHGVTVKWEPTANGGTSAEDMIDRVQAPNAQYQIFRDIKNVGDVTIQNVNFVYVPGDITGQTDKWGNNNKNYSADEIRNAEFQFLNTGNVTITDCTFEKVIVSPYGGAVENAGRSVTVKGCKFSNVYNAYAIKDIYPATATITGNIFTNCSGAIYFEDKSGGQAVTRQSITITNNNFKNIDQYAEANKTNFRGLIQFSANCVLNESTALTVSGNTIEGNVVNTSYSSEETGLPVLWQLCNLDGVTFKGWTPGKAFSIKVGADNLTLPALPSNDTFTFKGWASQSDYNGLTDLTNVKNFLQAGDKVTLENGASAFYYAVWEEKEQESEQPDPPVLPTGSLTIRKELAGGANPGQTFTFRITRYKTGPITGAGFTDGVKYITLAPGGSATISGLTLNTRYTVEELPVPGYTSLTPAVSGTITVDNLHPSVTFVNLYTGLIIEPGEEEAPEIEEGTEETVPEEGETPEEGLEELPKEGEAPAEEEPVDVPKTGDSLPSVGLALMLGFAACAVVLKKARAK